MSVAFLAGRGSAPTAATAVFVRRVPVSERPPYGSLFNRGWRFRVAAWSGAVLLYMLGCLLLLLGGLFS